MNTEKMTVHQALSELKVLDRRIQKESMEITYVFPNKSGNEKVHGVPVQDVVNTVKDKYKSLRTLIARRNAIKMAVTESNAQTVVTIGEDSYTVAAAIDMKNHGISYLMEILRGMEAQYKTAKNTALQANGSVLDERADRYVLSLYENADRKNFSEEKKKVREDFIKSQTVELVDPLKVVSEMEKLKDSIDRFQVSVDSALSVANAVTEIEVTYETF